MYSVGVAYFLWLISGFGALGFHRFYLGKIPSGLLWMFTGGLGMIGSIYDFFTLPGQVHDANLRRAIGLGLGLHAPRQDAPGWRYASDARSRVLRPDRAAEKNPERTILALAKENKGVLTVSEVALSADISVDESRKILDALVSKGIAELRVRKTGTLVYVIPEIRDKDEPLEDL